MPISRTQQQREVREVLADAGARLPRLDRGGVHAGGAGLVGEVLAHPARRRQHRVGGLLAALERPRGPAEVAVAFDVVGELQHLGVAVAHLLPRQLLPGGGAGRGERVGRLDHGRRGDGELGVRGVQVERRDGGAPVVGVPVGPRGWRGLDPG